MGEFFIYLVSFPFEWNSHLHFPGGGVVKNVHAMQGSLVLSLGLEDSLEKGIAIHSSVLDWRVPWTEEPGRL